MIFFCFLGRKIAFEAFDVCDAKLFGWRTLEQIHCDWCKGTFSHVREKKKRRKRREREESEDMGGGIHLKQSRPD